MAAIVLTPGPFNLRPIGWRPGMGKERENLD